MRLELTVPPGEGGPVLAEHQPLLGVDLDRKGSEAPAIIVTLGDLDAAMPQMTHRVTKPMRLWVEEEADGLAAGLEIDSEDAGKTIVIFEREQALPDRG
jgi:hypothetical protein